MTYFGTRLSENISRREPEGYLICLNVPVARTGIQDYLPSELGLSDSDDHLIPVLRPESEVFSPACMASFEGMPVTDDHPSVPEGVTSDNIRFLQRGHAHNVRRGAPPEDDLLLADLIITDRRLIDEILSGKREISCGYNYALCEENGTYVQREIRGNHVAVVDAGRAGPRVSIRDQRRAPSGLAQPSGISKPERASARSLNPISIDERSTLMNRKNLWRAKLMARMARDGDVESLSEMITEMMETPDPTGAAPAAVDPVVAAVVQAVEATAEPASPAAPAAPLEVQVPEGQPVLVDYGPDILTALNRIIELLTAACPADSADPTPQDECGNPSSQTDEDPAEAVVEAAGETLEATAEEVVEAVAEAMGLEPETVTTEDPVEELVSEILEGETVDPASPVDETAQAEVLSNVLEPDAEDEEENPEDANRAADALRTALAAFRPQMARMTPQERQRFNADIARRMRKLTGKAGKDRNPYAAIRAAAKRDLNDRTLGQRIMASRNANHKG